MGGGKQTKKKTSQSRILIFSDLNKWYISGTFYRNAENETGQCLISLF